MAKKSVTHFKAVVEAAQHGEKIWVGVDVHTKKYAVAILSESGVRHSFVTNSDNHALVKQFTDKGLSPEVIVYEAGLTGFGLYRACQAAGLKGMVVSANKIPKPACQGAKTDLIDCRRLAELAAKNELQGIYVPTEEEEARRALARRREKLKRNLAKVKAQIKSLLTCHNLPLPISWSKVEVARLSVMASGLKVGLRETLESMLSELDYFEKEKVKVSQEVKQVILPQGDVLQSVPGVGPITSAAFRAEMIDPERFESGEEVGSYTGLAPTVRQSGESRGQSHLAPSGQGPLRSYLIEAAWVLLRAGGWAADLYRRIYKRSGNCQKAITALARKLAVILWRLWLENRPYDASYQCPAPIEG